MFTSFYLISLKNSAHFWGPPLLVTPSQPCTQLIVKSSDEYSGKQT